jgi:SNF2 family DNA or RNA helicase
MRPLPDQEIAIKKFKQVPACLIGDSMGVGKTVTCLGRDFQLRWDYPEFDKDATLIISEKIGLDVWDYHLNAMGVPANEICVINPANRKPFEEALDALIKFQSSRLAPRAKEKLRPRYRYYIMHWDVLRSVPQINDPKLKFFHVIADEVHLAKNRKAVRTIHLKRIQTEFKTAASGTPADDKPWDLWSILHWLYPKKFRSFWRFFEQYTEYDTHPTRGYRIPTGVKNIPDLHRQIRPFYIRRTLKEVAPDMPEKIHVMPPIVVPMERKQRREYEAMRDKAIAVIGAHEDGNGGFHLMAPAVVAVLTRLQQMALATLTPEWDIITDEDYLYGDEDGFDITWDFPKIVLSKPSPKLDAIMNLITTNEEEPFVVFTQFRGMADLVEEECQRLKIPVGKITGEVLSKDKRTDIVKQFQAGETRVFTGTIAAAGKTITLTRANIAIFADRSWNPSKNEQAEDRLWRRTQRNTVRIYDIQAEDSIDQIRMDRINQKADWINALMNPRSAR